MSLRINAGEAAEEYLGAIAMFGTPNVLINTCLAFGTRLISQIPTQAYKSAALAGVIHGSTFAAWFEVNYHFFPDMSDNKSFIIGFAIASLVTVFMTPALTQGMISHKKAFLFSIVNNLSTYALFNLFPEIPAK